MSNLTSLEFFKQVLPIPSDGKEYFVVDIEPKYKVEGRKNGKTKIVHYTSDTVEGIIEKANLIDGGGSNAYFALSNFDATNKEYLKIKERSNGQKGRQAKFTSQIKCLFLDIDVGKEKNSYADDSTAVSEIGRVCSETKLPLPIINHSGNGLHAYWVFDKPIDIPTWLNLANDFKSLVEKHGLIIDPQVGTDAARILRVLDTGNYNNGSKKDVKNIYYNKETPKSFEEYRKIIPVVNKPVASPQIKLQRPKNAPVIDPATKNIIENNASKFSEIHAKSMKGEGCNQIKIAYEDQEGTSYDIWRAVLSTIKPCTDKYEWVQKMSEKHPEFNLDTAVNKMEDTGGPQSCETFEKFNPEGCKDCSVKNTVKRPLQLSSFIKEAKDEEIQVEKLSASTGDKAVFTIPRIPHPYFRAENGGVYIREYKQNKDTGEKEEIETQVYHNDLYLYKRLYDIDLGFLNLVRVDLPRDGVIEFEIPCMSFSSDQELKKILFKHGVVTDAKKGKLIVNYLIKFSNFLEAMAKAEHTYKQMGFDKESKVFVLGERLFTAGGARKTPISSRLLAHNYRFSYQGKLEKWKEATQELYARDGEELRQFCLGLGLAAPLYRYEPIAGSMVSMFSKDSGHNKSGTMSSIASMWGNPEHLFMTGKDTPASMMNRLGAYQSIPLCIDELTNIPPEKLSVLTYAVSEGAEPNRLQGSENKERTNEARWKLPVFASTNKSFEEKLQQYKPAVEGESARLLEIPFTRNGLSELDNKRLLTVHTQNHGVVATRFIPWLLGNQDKCQEMMRNYEAKMREQVNFGSSERFWVTMGYISLTGLHIGNELDIWDFDIDKTYTWLVNFLLKKMKQPRMISNNPSGVVGAFINRHATQMLIIKSDIDLRGDADTRPAPIREPRSSKDSLIIRYEPDTEKLFIDIEVFGRWIAEHTAFNMPELIELLKRDNICEGKKPKSMGKGWIPSSSQTMTLVFDANKLDSIDAS
tara:strand:- start:8007 stop:10937 length:2931 start_codon:yes stop_codon:yes gene_type:complete